MELYLIVSCMIRLYLVATVFASKSCRDVEYTFNTTETQYIRRVPPTELKYGTFCAWITTDDDGEFLGTIASYVANGKLDVVLLEGILGGMRLGLHGEFHDLQLPLAPNTEYNLCALLFLPDNYVKLYLNGMPGITLEYKNIENGSLPGGGTNIVGQRQGCDGGCFDPKRAFRGRLRNPLVWHRVLTDKELQALQLGSCSTDYLTNYAPETILPFGRIFPFSSCLKSEHMITNAGKSIEYLKFKHPLPALQSASICAWITTDNNGMIPGTVGSIVARNSVDILVATGKMIEGTPSLRLHVDGKVVMLPILLGGNTEHHFCVVLSPPFQKVLIFLDGQLALTLLLPNLQPIPAGSTIIVGQRQKCAGGCFVSPEAFNGRLKDFTIWDRALSATEMMAMTLSDECPTGHVVHLTKDNISVHKM